MTTPSEKQVAAEAVGRAIITAEHEHFVAVSLDNEEHIPRIRRSAIAVASALAGLGEPRAVAEALSRSLIQHGKALFIEEWVSDLHDGEDPERERLAAAAEFDRIAKRRGR